MKFLACFVLAAIVVVYSILVNYIIRFVPFWFGTIIYTLAIALALYCFVSVGQK
jgi:hypothetical protein